ncbi:hypothetical protein H0H92_012982 [Tricholoma furcatifolium]|nr:hypothetical protein H0H92_012982 [Tricholoma furcatifolium]
MATKLKQGPFTKLPPEVYPLIVAHLPLYAIPSTVLALALTSRHTCEIALPLLHFCLILKNEQDALIFLQRLLDDPELGRFVRELYIMSRAYGLVETSTNNPPSSDVIRRLVDVVSRGYLPLLHTLGLYDNYKSAVGFAPFEKGWWLQINEKCPRLRALILDGFCDNAEGQELWIEEAGMLRVPGITNFSIRIETDHLAINNFVKLSQHISSLAPMLHTLNISSPTLSLGGFFELNLPSLRSLSLAGFDVNEVNTSRAMSFWERHPSIEYLDIAINGEFAILQDGFGRWFARALPDKFLPELRYLRAHVKDAFLLAPILGQLLTLSIHHSINAQIPYLLRFLCPTGLTKLKSLGIGQGHVTGYDDAEVYDNGLYFEDTDGVFHPDLSGRTVFDNFMHSIVRSAPNLEEIGFQGEPFPLHKLMSIVNELNSFNSLKHLYYIDSGIRRKGRKSRGKGKPFERDQFLIEAKALAEAVPSLLSITARMNSIPPYLTGRITRHEETSIPTIHIRSGYWMKIGHEDEAFPGFPLLSTRAIDPE